MSGECLSRKLKDGTRGSRAYQAAAPILIAIAIALGGCGERVVQVSIRGTVKADSSVRVVTFDSLPQTFGDVDIDAAKEWSFGGMSDADSTEFDPRALRIDVAELPSGDLIVADHQRLKYLDAQGKLLRIVGRAGSGPGEFSAIRELCAQADSTVVVIDDDGRWSQWSREGEHLRTNAREGFIPPHACSPNGVFLAQIAGPGDPIPTAGARRTVGTKLFGVDGTPLADIGAFPAPEYFGQIFYEPGYWLTSSSLVLADPRTFEIRRYRTQDWRLTDTWRVNGALRTIGDAEWDSLQQSSIPRNAGAASRARLPRIENPRVFPGFSALLVDPQARIWLNVYFEPRNWLVIDRDGTRLSRVSLPYAAEARPQLIGFVRGGVAISHVDDDGAVRLSVHEIRGDTLTAPRDGNFNRG